MPQVIGDMRFVWPPYSEREKILRARIEEVEAEAAMLRDEVRFLQGVLKAREEPSGQDA